MVSWQTSRRTGALLFLALAVAACVPTAKALSQPSLCTTQLVRNATLLLLHRPTRRLLVIKSERKIRQIEVENERPGLILPDGVYSILRERDQRSTGRFRFAVGKGKPRVSWSGKALFAEGSMADLSKAESIRLPTKFARDLVRLTKVGAVLVVASSPSAIKLFDEIGFFDEKQLEPPEQPKCSNSNIGWKPRIVASPDEPVAVVVSERDRRVYIFEGGNLLGAHGVYVRYPHRDTGRHLFVAVKPNSRRPDRSWLALSLAGGGFVVAPPVKQANDVLDRFEFEQSAKTIIDEYIDRGVVLLVTERSARADTNGQKLITLLRSGP